ncbi:hypothetical protein AZ46_0202495 [Metabacillus indicus LMG 22858]|nr:hypothetical protein AZ46_0202495 [Metabacillus indicus LMG 22858]
MLFRAGEICKIDAILLISFPHEIPAKSREVLRLFLLSGKLAVQEQREKEKIASGHEIVVR